VATTTLKVKQERARERRRKIIAAATRLFGKQGIARTSLTDIARLSGVPLPSLYDYFKDKQDLVAAVPEENYLALYAQLAAERPEGRALPPREQLREIYVQNLEYIRANPDWGRVFFLEIWPSAAIGEARIRRAVDRYGLRYVELIRSAISSGAYDKGLDPYLAMSMLMGGMCHLTAVWLLYRRPYDLVQRGEELFDRIELSFLAGSRSPRRGRNKQTRRERT
jgi:AcrR family transcriptional regulator